jgi:hypothetical protein
MATARSVGCRIGSASVGRFRRAKGAKTLLISLHPDARTAFATNLAEG